MNLSNICVKYDCECQESHCMHMGPHLNVSCNNIFHLLQIIHLQSPCTLVQVNQIAYHDVTLAMNVQLLLQSC